MTDSKEHYLVFAAPLPVLVPLAGEAVFFPVRRIYCVGRNYLSHIREMGGDEREPPFFFQKPTDSIVHSAASIPYPPATRDLQYEVELVLAVGQSGRDITPAAAADYVFGAAVGIDLTRRDLQFQARDKGRPWETGKSFDHSAPIGAIHRLGRGDLPSKGRISLSVNGVVKQESDLAQMIWNGSEIIAHLSALFTLQPGDLIYTGTPAGVGPVVSGDRLEGSVDGLSEVVTLIA